MIGSAEPPKKTSSASAWPRPAILPEMHFACSGSSSPGSFSNCFWNCSPSALPSYSANPSIWSSFQLPSSSTRATSSDCEPSEPPSNSASAVALLPLTETLETFAPSASSSPASASASQALTAALPFSVVFCSTKLSVSSSVQLLGSLVV